MQLVLTFAWMVLLLGMGMGIVADRPVAAVFSAGSIGFGVMLGVYGVGAVIGSWLGSRLTAATEPAALVAGFVVAGVAGIGIWLAPDFWIVIACNMVWGVGDGVTPGGKTGIFQLRTPDAIRGDGSRGANESVLNLALLAGFLAAGPDDRGPRCTGHLRGRRDCRARGGGALLDRGRRGAAWGCRGRACRAAAHRAATPALGVDRRSGRPPRDLDLVTVHQPWRDPPTSVSSGCGVEQSGSSLGS